MLIFKMIIFEPYKKFADFSGRASRKEYWSFVGFFIFLSAILGFIDGFTGNFDEASGFGLMSGIFILGSLLPSISVGVRRLHDINKSGWWMLLSLIPFANIWILILFLFKGDLGNNRFGQSPYSFDYQDNTINDTTSDMVEKNNNEGPWEKSSKKSNENDSYSLEIANDLKKIDDLFKKSLITEEEKQNMRNKVLGLT